MCVDVCMYVRTRFSQYEMIISLLSCGEYWTRIMTSSGVENKSFPRKWCSSFNWIHHWHAEWVQIFKAGFMFVNGSRRLFICKRLLFWPGFQIGYQGLLSLSSASLFTLCKSTIWICEQRLSLFCYFCSQIQVCKEASEVGWFLSVDWFSNVFFYSMDMCT